jgi:hypothetical protein
MIIEVDEKELKINDAHIDRKYLSEVKVLDVEAMRNARGRDADPSAYLAIRFWSPRGVLIRLNDSRDSTPYWLISSKRADELAKAIS